MSTEFIRYDHDTNRQILSEINKQIDSVHHLREDSDKIITALESIYGGQAKDELQIHHQSVSTKLDELLQAMTQTKIQGEGFQDHNEEMDNRGGARFGV